MDKRFSHINRDPRFRRMGRKARKVHIDKRFKSMFEDKKFKLKYTVDKRGRLVNTTTNENLRKFYDLSDSEDSETEEVSKKEAVKPVKDKKTKTEKKREKQTKKERKEKLSKKSSQENMAKNKNVYAESEEESISGIGEEGKYLICKLFYSLYRGRKCFATKKLSRSRIQCMI